MTDILKEVLKKVPKDADIRDSKFEGANIILYTGNADFFLNQSKTIREIVNTIKKRIEVRPDPSLPLELEKAEEKIKAIIPKEAGKVQIIFDPQRSQVIIEAEKPGLAIGRSGEVLHEIKKETLWVPFVKRIPAIRSKIIENIRTVLYENNDYRKKFLHSVGKRIYNGWIRDKKSEWIRLSFLGASRQVGRSCYLLQTPESRILLDCGIDVAAQTDKDAYPFLEAPEFDIKELDAIILSHPHIDHCGFIPYLYKMGYRGPLYLTLPSRDISALSCLDVVNISAKEAKKALYGSTDIKEMIKHTIPLEYEEVTDITPDVRLTFYNAGHVLGSSLCHLHIGNGLHNFVYSGDLHYDNSNLLAAASTKYPRLETLMIEGTYGGKDDKPANRKESEEELIRIIKETVARKGKVLLPVLGVGRSQEIMVILDRLVNQGELPKLPIYVQGLVWDITAIHTAYPDFFNSYVRKAIFHRDQNPFLNEVFKHVGSRKEMEQVLEEGPCIILATSGMMTGGSSVEYFKKLADNAKNSLVFTCYQGQGSLGRRLQEGEKEIRLEDEKEAIPVKMDIHSLRGFTGHSNRQQLLSFIQHLDPKPRKIIIVHGESSKCLELASSIHKLFRVETNAPKNMEVLRLR